PCSPNQISAGTKEFLGTRASYTNRSEGQTEGRKAADGGSAECYDWCKRSQRPRRDMTEYPQRNDRRTSLNAEGLLAATMALGRRLNVHLAAAGRFLSFAVRRFLEDRCLDQAASLSYTTLLSLVPVVALCVVT